MSTQLRLSLTATMVGFVALFAAMFAIIGTAYADVNRLQESSADTIAFSIAAVVFGAAIFFALRNWRVAGGRNRFLLALLTALQFLLLVGACAGSMLRFAR